MSPTDVLVALVAIYGAVLSTLNYRDRRARDRLERSREDLAETLNVEVRANNASFETGPTAAFGNRIYAPDPTFSVEVIAINRGLRAIHVRALGVESVGTGRAESDEQAHHEARTIERDKHLSAMLVPDFLFPGDEYRAFAVLSNDARFESEATYVVPASQ